MENFEQTELTPTPKPKIQKLKIFKLTQKNFAAVGISPSLIDQPHPLNEKIVWGFLILTLSIICNLMYIIGEAKTIVEYTQSFYMFCFAAITIIAWAITLRNGAKLFRLINGFENFVNTS